MANIERKEIITKTTTYLIELDQAEADNLYTLLYEGTSFTAEDEMKLSDLRERLGEAGAQRGANFHLSVGTCIDVADMETPQNGDEA